jgi:hypothetical protein
MLTKLCLKSGSNLVGVDSLVAEKSDDRSLVTLHHKRTVDGFWRPEWKDDFLESDGLTFHLIYLACQRLHTVEIYCRERQTPDLSA